MKAKTFPLTLLAWACASAMAQTLPSGPMVRQGSGTVETGGTGMVIRQTTDKLVLDWQTFSIGSGNSMRFDQPSSSSIAVNRVIGGSPSEIAGTLSSNGRVYLQNAAGVLFTQGARVDVGGLVATTLDIDVDRLDRGQLRLSGDANRGAVVNQGSLNAAQGGHVVLAGPKVDNSGSISTPGGSAVLAAGARVDVDPSSSGLLTVSVPVGAIGARLGTSGSIVADGGSVSLQAAALDASRDTVMQIGGVVRARSVREDRGTIVLDGGDSGVVTVSGALDARGDDVQRGGTVKVLGEQLALIGNARIDASGGMGGGSVEIGGGFQGQGPDRRAQATYVGQGASVDASARQRGDGGQVVVWSDQVTGYHGQVAARGGSDGGNGGRVEVSGRERLDFAGGVDTRAPKGRSGSLLLDPENLSIGSDADANGDGTKGDDLTGTQLLYGDQADAYSTVSAGRVASLLATTNVTLQAHGTLNVDAPVAVAAGGAASRLTLNGYQVHVDAPMTLNNTSLIIDTQATVSDNIRINAPVTSLESVALTASFIYLSSDVTVPELSLSTSPGSTQAAIYQFDGTVSTNHLTVNAPGFELWLPTEANRIARMDLLAGLAEVHGGNGGSAMSVAGAVDGDFILVGHDDVVQHGALRVTGNFTLAADANATLTNAGNDFNSIGFTVGGSLDAYDANGFAAGGTADRAVRLGTGGVFTLAGDITSQDSATPSNIEITTAGFDNSANARLVVQDGGRFLIRSSDYTQDNLGGIGFSAADRANLNYTVLGGWTGADPTTGNGYYTNRTGTIDTPNGDRPGISREYDTTKGFAYLQSGHAAQGTLAGGGTASIGDYTVRSTGTFDDKNAGTGKGYDVAGTNDVSATATDGSAVYGLHYDAFRREAGPLLPGGLGNALSTVTPRTLTTSGITALDHGYDGTDHVGLDSSGATLNGVLSGDQVRLDASHASGATDTPVPGDHKPVTVSGLGLSGTDAGNYVLQSPALSANVTNGLRESFERLRDKQYLQALADDQEPFRREQLDALLAGFSKENIRRPLSRGLVYETGLAAPAVDDIGDPAMKPCTVDSVVCRHRKEAK